MAKRPTKRFRKDAADVLDYLNDWQSRDRPFLEDGETISTSTFATYATDWTATTDITIDSQFATDTTTTVWLSSGTEGEEYFVTNHVVTDQGREKDESFSITIEEQ